jgi:hypothetical protein
MASFSKIYASGGHFIFKKGLRKGQVASRVHKERNIIQVDDNRIENLSEETV